MNRKDHCSSEHVHLFILHLAVHKVAQNCYVQVVVVSVAVLMVELVTADLIESFWSKYVSISGSCRMGVCILDQSLDFHSRY